MRELLMAGRLPESYVASEHLLDLRARVRLRSRAGRSARRMAAADSRGAYHHGHPLTASGDPVVLGAGDRLFGETQDKIPLRLVEARPFGEGVVSMIYAPATADG